MTRGKPMSLVHRLAWFAGLWTVSVVALGVVSALLRLIIGR